LAFKGSLHSNTKLEVQSYGQEAQIAPFVWPVTSWSKTDKPTCDLLSQRYNLTAAQQFFTLAQKAIVAHGGRPVDRAL
jgi:hypothetical protein